MQASTLLVILACVVYSKAQATPGVFFSNIGGAGSYPQVVNQPPGTWPPPCNVGTPCQQTTVNIPAQPLAPFHEEFSIQLRGPLQMTRIAIYQNINGQEQLVSNWQPNMPMLNMVFLMNSANNWSVCQGNALGYANAAGDTWSQTPQNFGGYLAGGLELTVMSGVPCNGDCGWYRGTGYHGWAGDKMFVIETSMPSSTNGQDMPAVWSLNAKIPRTGQYGCNCGRSGCGEFDIAEVLSNGDDKAYQTIYSYNGNLGSPAYFPRPVDTVATYVVHYSLSDDKIFAVNLPGGCFQYAPALSAGYVANIHALATDVNIMATSPNTNLVGTCPSNPPANTASPTTVVPITVVPTTATPTTRIPITIVQTTTPSPTQAITTQATTTLPPTTTAPTIVAPTTTSSPTTVSPTTIKATTVTPSTAKPTTVVPSTSKPTTVVPSTAKVTTVVPSTAKVTTAVPSTAKVTTAAPTTTRAATTTRATTSAPTTSKTATTSMPTTKPTTGAPRTTSAVTTAQTTTRPPTSPVPTTAGLVLCGQYYCASCCNDMVQGPVCIYQPNLYTCASGKRLCGTGQDVCGTACYDTSMYACQNGNIVQK